MPAPENIPRWSAPREWEGDTAFVICGGSSVDAHQRNLVRQMRHKKGYRWLAIKQSVELVPDADVMLCGNKDDAVHCKRVFPMFHGKYLVARTWYANMPERTLFMRRLGSHKGGGKHRLSRMPTHLAGFDTGTSGLNLAYLMGASRIVVLGMDMTGGHWMKGHPMPSPPRDHFIRHMAAIEEIAEDLAKEKVEVFNASPVSRVKCWPFRSLESFL